MEGNNSHKQTNKNNYFSWSEVDLTLSGNFGTLQATKKLILIRKYWRITAWKCRRAKDNEVPKGTRLGRQNWTRYCIQVYVCFKFVLTCTQVWCSLKSSVATWRWQFCQPKRSLSPIWSFKAQSQQRKIKLPKIQWLKALKWPRNTG